MRDRAVTQTAAGLPDPLNDICRFARWARIDPLLEFGLLDCRAQSRLSIEATADDLHKFVCAAVSPWRKVWPEVATDNAAPNKNRPQGPASDERKVGLCRLATANHEAHQTQTGQHQSVGSGLWHCRWTAYWRVRCASAVKLTVKLVVISPDDFADLDLVEGHVGSDAEKSSHVFRKFP